MTRLRRFPIYRVVMRDPSGPLDLITFLGPDDFKVLGGWPGEGFVGKLLGPGTELVPANFAQNRAFVVFMHNYIRTAVPQLAEYANEATRLGSGWVHVHDARAFEVDPQVASFDVIGSFPVVKGELIADLYTPNPEHRILSEHGMVTPHPEIQDGLLRALRELRFEPGKH